VTNNVFRQPVANIISLSTKIIKNIQLYQEKRFNHIISTAVRFNHIISTQFIFKINRR